MNPDWNQLLPAWTVATDGRSITRTLRFEDFAQAWAFMKHVALAAQDLNHHPDWRNVYNTVEITLTTHDAGGLTSLDLALAQRIDAAGAGGLPLAGR